MGKTCKGAAKTAAKIAKAKAKLARKCKGKCGLSLFRVIDALAVVAVVLILLVPFALALCGCSTTGPQPSRAITQNNDFRDCRITINAAKAEGECAPVEMWTCTQANEGNESVSPTATPTNTTDIKPDLDLNTTGGKTAGVLESIVGAFGAWLTTPSGKAACTAGNCTDGECGECGDCTVK